MKELTPNSHLLLLVLTFKPFTNILFAYALDFQIFLYLYLNRHIVSIWASDAV